MEVYVKHILAGLIVTMGLVVAGNAVTITADTSFPSKSNIWTTKKDAALDWGTLNDAVTVIIVGDSQNCGKCKTFDKNTLSSTKWKTFVAENNLALVYWDYSAVAYNEWYSFARANTVDGNYPTVNIYLPGKKLKARYLARGTPQSNPDYLISLLTPLVAQKPGTIGFTTSALTVKEDAGSVPVTISRTGGNYGAQSFKVTAAAGDHNGATNVTLTWASGNSANQTVNIPLVDDGVYTSPTQRTFTVSLAKTSADSKATLGTSSLTVKVLESIPYAAGTVGFDSGRQGISEGASEQLAWVKRTDGVVGEISVDYAIYTNNTEAFTGTLTWTNMDSVAKPINLAGYFDDVSTAGFDGISTNVMVKLSNLVWSSSMPTPTLGIAEQMIEFRDEDIFSTIPEGDFAFSSADDESWFYSTNDVVFAAPLAVSETALALTFTAPDYGFLAIEFGGSAGGDGTLTLTNGVNGEFLSVNGNEWTNAVLAVNKGDVVSLAAVSTGAGYSPQVKIVEWVPVAMPSNPGPADGASFIKSEHATRTLTWTATSLVCCVSFGSTQDVGEFTDGGVWDSGVSLEDVGIPDAEGTVYWNVTLEADGDLGTRLSQPGPVWAFTIFDKPEFNSGFLNNIGKTTVFTRTDLAINASASRAVTYTADFGVLGGVKGLTIDPKTGLISGTSKKVGTFPVKVTAYDSGGRATSVTFNITVEKMTSAKYNGVVVAANGLPAGTMTLSQSTTGRATAKLIMDGTSTSLKASLQSNGNGSLIANLIATSGMSVPVVLGSGNMTGSIIGKSATVAGQLATKGHVGGSYTMSLEPSVLSGLGDYHPEGCGYLTVTTKANGIARYAGLLPNGTRISGSTPHFNALPVDGGTYSGLAIYQALYLKKGYVSLMAPLNSSVFTVTGLWDYPGKLTREDAVYAQLGGTGAPYVKASGFSSLNGKTASATGMQSAPVTAAGASLVATSADLKIKGNAATGLISGKAGRNTIKGVVIQTTGEAFGQYLAPHPMNSRFKQSNLVEIQ